MKRRRKEGMTGKRMWVDLDLRKRRMKIISSPDENGG
jgi:hypothetical protein